MKRILSLLLAGTMLSAAAETAVLEANKPGAEVSPTMYGIFFEDINYGADGGLYAEMVKNRSFEFQQPLTGWTAFGNLAVRDDGPFEANPHYVRLSPSGHSDKYTGLQNEGFFGVTVHKDSTYLFSAWLRAPEGPAKIRVELADPSSMGETQVYAKADIDVTSKDWQRYTATLKANNSVNKGILRIFLAHPDKNIVDAEHISLFPEHTWNGLRTDLVQALEDLKPGVFRFPGGCIVEGTEVGDRYQWKHTVGQVENRPTTLNRWHYTFPHRFYPDYYQSYGLGFYEYFLLSEKIGAAPLPVLNVGMVCQFQNRDPKAHPHMDELQPYIQDALDLVEFANGDTTTVWGKLRADMGHPAPFGLKYLAIGNEQWGPTYVEHLEPFIKAIRAKYPDIKVIGSSGPDSEGKNFDYLWPEMTRLKVDFVDEHFYRPEKWFLSQGARYDSYDRKGPKVFAGEYACHGKGKKLNHFNAALLEGAFMTGLERNADIVEMATYAPLFAHVEGWQWRPDMIWFDNSRSMRTSSYYIQQLYMHNRGSRVLPLLSDGKPLTGQDDIFASAVIDEPSGDIIIKVANTSDTEQPFAVDFKGLKRKQAYTKIIKTRLEAPSETAENTLDNPGLIAPVTTTEGADIKGRTRWSTFLPAKTFTVYRFTK